MNRIMRTLIIGLAFISTFTSAYEFGLTTVTISEPTGSFAYAVDPIHLSGSISSPPSHETSHRWEWKIGDRVIATEPDCTVTLADQSDLGYVLGNIELKLIYYSTQFGNETAYSATKTFYVSAGVVQFDTPTSSLTSHALDASIQVNATVSKSPIPDPGYPQWNWYLNDQLVATGQTATFQPSANGFSAGTYTLKVVYKPFIWLNMVKTGTITLVQPTCNFVRPAGSVHNLLEPFSVYSSWSNTPVCASGYPQYKWYLDNTAIAWNYYKNNIDLQAKGFTEEGMHTLSCRYYYADGHYTTASKQLQLVVGALAITSPDTATSVLNNYDIIQLTGDVTNPPTADSGYPQWEWLLGGIVIGNSQTLNTRLVDAGISAGEGQTLELRYYYGVDKMLTKTRSIDIIEPALTTDCPDEVPYWNQTGVHTAIENAPATASGYPIIKWYVDGQYLKSGTFIYLQPSVEGPDHTLLISDANSELETRYYYDETHYVSASKSIHIQNSNRPPVIYGMTITPGTTFEYGQDIVVDSSTTDPDGLEGLTYTLKLTKEGAFIRQWDWDMSVDHNPGDISGNWASLCNDSGSGCYTFTLTGNDGLETVSQSVDINVIQVDDGEGTPPTGYVGKRLNETVAHEVTVSQCTNNPASVTIRWLLDGTQVSTDASYTYTQSDDQSHVLKWEAVYNGTVLNSKIYRYTLIGLPEVQSITVPAFTGYEESVSLSADIVHPAESLNGYPTAIWYAVAADSTVTQIATGTTASFQPNVAGLSSGTYTIRFEYTYAEGETALTSESPLQITDPGISAIDFIPATDGVTVYEGNTASLSCTFSGNLSQYQCLWYVDKTTNPSPAYVENVTSTTTYQYTRPAGDKSLKHVLLEIRDTGGQLLAERTWILSCPNRAPSITSIDPAGLEFTVGYHDTVNFHMEATDPDGDPITYTWHLVGGAATDIIVEGQTFSGTISELIHGDIGGCYRLDAKASDSTGSTTRQIQLNILKPVDDQAETVHQLTAGSDFTVNVSVENCSSIISYPTIEWQEDGVTIPNESSFSYTYGYTGGTHVITWIVSNNGQEIGRKTHTFSESVPAISIEGPEAGEPYPGNCNIQLNAVPDTSFSGGTWRWYVAGTQVATGQNTQFVPVDNGISVGTYQVRVEYEYDSINGTPLIATATSEQAITISAPEPDPEIQISMPQKAYLVLSGTLIHYQMTMTVSNPAASDGTYPKAEWYVRKSGTSNPFTQVATGTNTTLDISTLQEHTEYDLKAVYKYWRCNAEQTVEAAKQIIVGNPDITIGEPVAGGDYPLSEEITLNMTPSGYVNDGTPGYPRYEWYLIDNGGIPVKIAEGQTTTFWSKSIAGITEGEYTIRGKFFYEQGNPDENEPDELFVTKDVTINFVKSYSPVIQGKEGFDKNIPTEYAITFGTVPTAEDSTYPRITWKINGMEKSAAESQMGVTWTTLPDGSGITLDMRGHTMAVPKEVFIVSADYQYTSTKTIHVAKNILVSNEDKQLTDIGMRFTVNNSDEILAKGATGDEPLVLEGNTATVYKNVTTNLNCTLFIHTNGSLPDGYKIESHFLDPSGQEVSAWSDWTSHYAPKLMEDGSGVEYAYTFPYVPITDFPVTGIYTWELRIVYPDGYTQYQEPYMGRVYLNVADLTAEIQPATWNRDTRCTGSSIVLRMPKVNWRMGYLSDGTEVLAYDPILLQLTDGTNTYTSKVDDPKTLSEYVQDEWDAFVFQFDQVIPDGTYTGKILDAATGAEPSYYTDMETKPQLTVASGIAAVPTPDAEILPKTLRILTQAQLDSGLTQEDTIAITVPGWQFTGSDKRWIEIVRDDQDKTVVVPKTEISNVVEDPVSGNTTLSYTFADVTSMAKGNYIVRIYQEQCATDPVAAGNIVIVERPVKLVFFHDDHLGTPRLITDEDGQTVSTHDYLAYGEEITTADFQTNRMKFTGHERDPETGLDYMLARYYTAGSGRFLQVDPGYDYDIMNPMSFNLYSYVRGNPMVQIDPTGKWTTKWRQYAYLYYMQNPNLRQSRRMELLEKIHEINSGPLSPREIEAELDALHAYLDRSGDNILLDPNVFGKRGDYGPASCYAYNGILVREGRYEEMARTAFANTGEAAGLMAGVVMSAVGIKDPVSRKIVTQLIGALWTGAGLAITGADTKEWKKMVLDLIKTLLTPGRKWSDSRARNEVWNFLVKKVGIKAAEQIMKSLDGNMNDWDKFLQMIRRGPDPFMDEFSVSHP